MAAPPRAAGQNLGYRSPSPPNGNFRAVRDNDPLLNNSPRQRPGQPVRPQIGRKAYSRTNDSPRQKCLPVSPATSRPSTSIVTSPVQCKSAKANLTRLVIPDGNAESLNGKQHQRPASSPVSGEGCENVSFRSPTEQKKLDPQLLFPINPGSREHIEIKACLLAHRHHLDVDELQRIRGDNQVALNRSKMQRIISRGGAFSVDGSTHEEAKRKTTFLLRHFFTLQDSCASPQAQLLCDVVDGWAVGDHATPDDISRLWKSIDHHIEQSYLLRRKLVAKSDPDEISVVIAMDCLKQLPQRLPKYRRVLDVIIAVIESGLYLNNAADTALTELPDPSLEDDELPHDRKIPYFEAFRALHNLAHTEEALQLPSSDRSSLKAQDKSSDTSFRQHIESLLGQLENSDEKKGLFRFLLRGNLAMLADLACEEILNHYLGSRNLESADMFFSLLMQRVSHEEVKRLLTVISRAHSSELQKFALDNIDVLLENESTATGTVTEKKAPALFQRLVDSHPQDFADILWQSPYLTAHVFQGSENLVARVLEQNVYRISQVLTLRGDVLLPLLSHTFKENTTVLEEFLVHHPRGLADLLMNRSSSIAAIVKAKPYILSDILQACHKTLTTVLSSTPEIVSSAIKANPQLLPQIVRDDSSILAAVFATVPQCLGDTLEKRPDFFLDIAHRKPALICRLFAEHPDLLLEPLEANPALFTTFLLYHRNVLPDFNGPGFDPTVYKLRNKQLVEIGVQTINKLNHERRKPRAREKLRVQCEELVESLRAMPGKDASPVATSPETTEVNPEEVIPEDVLSPPQILNEIARLYVAKIASDERDDTMNRKRQSIADFVMELYTLELGFKPVAKKKLVKLLSAAKQVGTVPEAMRIKWFRRFMNAIPGDRPLPQTALDFYLLALQHLIPGGQLALRLEAASLHTCTVSQSTLKAFVDDPLVSRLFDSKEQRQRMLALQNISTSARQDSADTGAKSSVTMLGVLRLDDVLDLVMKFWMQYQLRMRDEWAVVFRSIIPDATGEAHFDAFSTMVRTKVPGLDNRTLMKIYNSCGEENEHGQFILFSEDFTFVMSILQEQRVLRQYTSSSSSIASSTQLQSPFSTLPVSGTSKH